MYIPTVIFWVVAAVASFATCFCCFFLFVAFVSRKEEKQKRKDNTVIGSMIAELHEIAGLVERTGLTSEKRGFLRQVRMRIMELHEVSTQENPVERQQAITKLREGGQEFRDSLTLLTGYEIADG